jgi:PBP1b-binding outer membrane lipoprotein LpoB
MKKIIYMFLFLSVLILTGCSSGQNKYEDCIESCKKNNPGSLISSEAVEASSENRSECMNICVQKYK